MKIKNDRRCERVAIDVENAIDITPLEFWEKYISKRKPVSCSIVFICDLCAGCNFKGLSAAVCIYVIDDD